MMKQIKEKSNDCFSLSSAGRRGLQHSEHEKEQVTSWFQIRPQYGESLFKSASNKN
jgi:hypothetical protein